MASVFAEINPGENFTLATKELSHEVQKSVHERSERTHLHSEKKYLRLTCRDFARHEISDSAPLKAAIYNSQR